MPGQQFDAETGLFYNNARYYDPVVGRYLSSDPIGLAGGANTFGYAGHAPAISVDQDGTYWFVAIPARLVVTYLANAYRLNATSIAIAELAAGTGLAARQGAFKGISSALPNGSSACATVGAVFPVAGKLPLNAGYAGRAFPLPPSLAYKYPAGVSFTEQGFPELSRYALRRVTSPNLTGKPSDFALADKLSGLPRPRGYTWHHVEDGMTLLLVPTDLHQAVRHTGGAAILKNS